MWKKANPEANFGELGKLVGEQWDNLDINEKKKYEEKAAQDKERYEREKQIYDRAQKASLPVSSRDNEKKAVDKKNTEKDEGSDEDSDEETKRKKKPIRKDANAPKRALSAFMFYVSTVRENVRKANPEASFGVIGKLLGEQWCNLDINEKKKYEEMAAQDKARYEREKQAYDGAHTGNHNKPSLAPLPSRIDEDKATPIDEDTDEETESKEKPIRSKRLQKDRNRPKRPFSAFMIYSTKIRESVKKANPEANFGVIAKLVGEQWCNLDLNEKKEYEELAAQDKARYEREMQVYERGSHHKDKWTEMENGADLQESG